MDEVEINGHPGIVMPSDNGQPVLLTVCAECGELRSILFLDEDRWFCTRCRAEGASRPNLYPIA